MILLKMISLPNEFTMALFEVPGVRVGLPRDRNVGCESCAERTATRMELGSRTWQT